jgi:hypothetical protein
MGGQKHKKHGKSGGGGKSKPQQQQNTSSGARKPVTINDISPEFQTIILDFLRDIDCSFPEYREVLAPYLGYSHEMKPMPDELYIELYSHCREIYPVKFFDILYKNETLFAKAQASAPDAPDALDAASVEFIPGVDFRDIWATEDITENTKDIIWKYLQLILFSIVNNLSDMGSFGDTAKLFEAIDDNELKTKLEEVIGEMGDMFGNAAAGAAGGAAGGGGGAMPNAEGLDETFKKATEFMNEAFAGAAGAGAGTGPTSTPPIPDASSIHEHLSGILNGKIGKLAKEIAEETAADLNLDMENETSMKGIFQQLLKNPGKLSGIIKSVGSKLDSKLKSGELKESEIMQEASELMSKMKSMPGMNNLASMLSKMGMNVPGGMGGGGGGGGKVNFGAMQSQLNKNMKQAQMRERLLKKVQDKQAAAAAAAQAAQQQQQAQAHAIPQTPNTAVFKSGEKPAKTPRQPMQGMQAQAQAQAQASSESASAIPKQKSD